MLKTGLQQQLARPSISSTGGSRKADSILRFWELGHRRSGQLSKLASGYGKGGGTDKALKVLPGKFAILEACLALGEWVETDQLECN